jgi:predicted AAA+ superfamily ATPase
MIVRDLKDNLQRKFNMGKAIVLIGPRQVGKTTLVHAIEGYSVFVFDGDDSVVAQTLAKANTETLKV